jgi:L-rhamnose-H+ transport protein
MNELTLSLLLVAGAGTCHATFGLGQKNFAPFAWEAFWFLFAVVSMLVIPPLWTLAVVPDVGAAIAAVPRERLILSAFFGACWGVGAIFWAKSLMWIGLALTYGICLSIAMALGSLVPMLQIPNITANPAFPFIIFGTVLMLAGVAVITVAGVMRDRLQTRHGVQIRGVVPGFLFRAGVVLAVFGGVSAALENIGYNHALPAARVAQQQGASPQNASLVPWLIVFVGGFLVQGGYALFIMLRNRSYRTYVAKGATKGYLKLLLTSLFWYAALALYGQGAATMGKLGTSIGWTMFLSLSLIISNCYAYMFGEWSNARDPLKVLMIGNAVLLVSWIILGYANSLTLPA